MMKLRGIKRWKKVVLVLLGLVVLSQLPFIYRRFQLRRLSHAINELNSQRVVDEAESGYLDYKGVIHVHSLLGGHSTGTLTEIIEAANAEALDFVVMTEHPAKQIDTAEMTLKGFHGKALFINGSEISTSSGDRFLFPTALDRRRACSKEGAGRPCFRRLPAGVS
jgi:cell division protein FtsL